MNPADHRYKFLFKGVFDEVNLQNGLEFVRGWAADKGKGVSKQKQRNIPQQGMFEISVWLK